MRLDSLTQPERDILFRIYKHGPDCAKFISRQLKLELAEAMQILRLLQQKGWLERVEGRFLKPKGWRHAKHMNHTYYDLTRKAKLALRKYKE